MTTQPIGCRWICRIPILFRFRHRPDWLSVETSRSLILQSSGSCAADPCLWPVAGSVCRADCGSIGAGTRFIGVTLLAGATSLPELTTSITAVRIGAYTMAISNIFGSNLIMLVLVFPADVLFRSSPDIFKTPRLRSAFGACLRDRCHSDLSDWLDRASQAEMGSDRAGFDARAHLLLRKPIGLLSCALNV